MADLKFPTQLCDFSELAQLITINSFTKNKAGVDQVSGLFNQWMVDLGFTVNRHKREHIGDHILYSSPVVEGKKILLLGHFDTVFPPNTFVDFREDEEWIYGPGVCDMKGGNYVALCALRQVFKQYGQITNIDVLMVSDEESGSDDSRHLTQSIAENYDFCLVFEAAGCQNELVTARKGVATYHIEIKGKAAHAGNHFNEGINANLAAAHMLIELTSLTNVQIGTTVNAGKIEGGIGANTISPRASLIVEGRFSSNKEKYRVLTEIERIVSSQSVEGAKASFTGGLQRDVMTSNAQQLTLIEELEDIIGRPLKLEKRGGVSDANTISAMGVPTLDGFGPYGDGDHTLAERANKASFFDRISDVTRILCHYTELSMSLKNTKVG